MATFATASSRLEPSGRRTSSIAGGPIRVPGRVDDFASFMMLFHDIFLLDEFYTDFGMTDDVQTSNVIGSGAQFDVKLLQLRGQMALRTSGEASSRLTEGKVVVLKRPRRLFRQDGSFISDGPIRNIVNEFRVISHPRLRHHPNILDVYGFAWERTDNVPGVAVWPIIMEEYGSFGTLDEFLSQATPRDLTTKLQLMGDIAAGIQALHRCGISHSDLKPDNILVCETAEGHPVAKLADFGLSIITSERVAADEWDSGTPNWTVPEWGRVCPNESIMSADGKQMKGSTSLKTEPTNIRLLGSLQLWPAAMDSSSRRPTTLGARCLWVRDCFPASQGRRRWFPQYCPRQRSGARPRGESYRSYGLDFLSPLFRGGKGSIRFATLRKPKVRMCSACLVGMRGPCLKLSCLHFAM